MTPTPTEQVRSPHLLRRLLAVIFGLALVGGLTTACSSDDSDDSSSDNSASDDSYYPHTMATRFEDVTIEKKPERILALGPAVADRLLTIGVTPIAVATESEITADSHPWIYEEIKDISSPDIYNYQNKDYEKIASLKPDLIVGLISDEDDFNKLSTIAPTITPDSQENNPNWKTQFLTTAESVNKVTEAEKKISSIESAYKSVGDRVNNIGQMTYNWVMIRPQGNIEIGNGSLLELFGLKPNQDNSQRGDSTISRENINRLDADYIGLWIQNEEQKSSAESDPQFRNLPAVQNGNVFWAYTPEANAINLPSPMALDWLLEQLTPSIEALGK